jgi:malto-oligosyltrehalose trehalohydrolase
MLYSVEERPGVFERSGLEAPAGTRYGFCRDGGPLLPDPGSRFQPEGVFAASEVIDLRPGQGGTSGWAGLKREELVIYEIHVGTFTPEGTYAGLLTRLDHLRDLGISAIELMPLAHFAGGHGWGYDGVFHFAPFAPYGRPEELLHCIQACHERGLAVILDLVTNHFGPEGNALWTLAPDFFRPDRPTAWSAGMNWEAEAVMAYFSEAAVYWQQCYGIDGLRLDAFHAIPPQVRHRHLHHLITSLEQALPPEWPQFFILLESVDNQNSLLRCSTPRIKVAQINFDFQRATHALLTGEGHGEYADFSAPEVELGRSLAQGFAFSGRYSSYHRRVLGESGTRPPDWHSIVNFIQNHDTAGNRYWGQRLDALVDDPERLRAATALLLFHPALPFIFMGQEWGAQRPFFFFTDFPAALGQAVHEGRLRLFHERPPAGTEPPGTAPGCQHLEAFHQSKLDWNELHAPAHRDYLEFFREALALRRQLMPHLSARLEDTKVEQKGAQWLIELKAVQPEEPPALLAANLDRQRSLCLDMRHATLLYATQPLSTTPQSTLPPKTTALFRTHR